VIEMPKDTFLVEGWNSGPIPILYKHKVYPGKIFELQVIFLPFTVCSIISYTYLIISIYKFSVYVVSAKSTMITEEKVRITLVLRKGQSWGLNFKISDYIKQDCDISISERKLHNTEVC